MKKCTHCGGAAANAAQACPSCGGQSFVSVCAGCGTTFDSRFCPACGLAAGDEGRRCHVCGKQTFAAFCPHCGAGANGAPAARPVARPAAPPPPPPPPPVPRNADVPTRRVCNKWVAFLLCFFLGIFGVHKFYEGKIGMGILYFFTGGLLGIGWLIDWIVLLGKPEQYTP